MAALGGQAVLQPRRHVTLAHGSVGFGPSLGQEATGPPKGVMNFSRAAWLSFRGRFNQVCAVFAPLTDVADKRPAVVLSCVSLVQIGAHPCYQDVSAASSNYLGDRPPRLSSRYLIVDHVSGQPAAAHGLWRQPATVRAVRLCPGTLTPNAPVTAALPLRGQRRPGPRAPNINAAAAASTAAAATAAAPP